MATIRLGTVQVRITDPGSAARARAGNFFHLTSGEVKPGVGGVLAEVLASAWPLVRDQIAPISAGATPPVEGATENGVTFIVEPVSSSGDEVPFLQTLTHDQLSDLRQASRMRTCKRGEEIVAQGGEASCLYMIDKGQADVEKGDQVIATLPRGSVFGEMSILTGKPAVATVRSRGMSVILTVEKDRLEELLAADPDLATAFSQLMSGRLGESKDSTDGSPESDGFYGTLSMIEPADLVQSMLGARRTGELTLTRDAQQGKVWFENGQVTGARVAGEQAEDAFLELLKWKQGKFAFQPARTPAEGAIECDTMGLLMETMRQIDEENAQSDAE